MHPMGFSETTCSLMDPKLRYRLRKT
uniref:Uncharacterized protein n=1 Tax=Anguilla anguilla TaxID=7936 RepID=A0A0E9VZN4_ANGAN